MNVHTTLYLTGNCGRSRIRGDVDMLITRNGLLKLEAMDPGWTTMTCCGIKIFDFASTVITTAEPCNGDSNSKDILSCGLTQPLSLFPSPNNIPKARLHLGIQHRYSRQQSK
jgi:hypothetical protein